MNHRIIFLRYNYMLKLFAIPIFLASTLIFYIQPLIGKVLLPHFGGSSGVWGTCLLFFQSCLLVGYLYVHALNKFASLKNQIISHSIFCLISLLLLFNLNNLSNNYFVEYLLKSNNIIEMPQFQIIIYLAMILFIPMVLLSATTPLLQNWYSQTTLKHAINPYPLYSISSLANIFGLLAYIFILEPVLGLNSQFSLWKVILLLMVLLLFICGYITINNKAGKLFENHEKDVTKSTSITSISKGKILYWLLLSMIPSSLLLSVTQITTTNISSVPLLWVIPLILYLLSYVIAFSGRQKSNLNKLIYTLPFSLLILIYFPISAVELSMKSTLFFVISLLCHYKIYRTRPTTKFLTNFYLIIGLGGILGSVFNTFIAPILFNDYYEFPIMVILGTLIILFKKKNFSITINNSFLPCCFIILAIFLISPIIHTAPLSVFLLSIFIFTLFYYRKFYTFGILSSVLLAYLMFMQSSGYMYMNRNFYGKQVVKEVKELHYLVSGSTVHSLQYNNGKMAFSYYRPIKELFDNNKNILDIAVVGLGAGTVACMKKPQDRMDFYEINQDMITIAKNSKLFTYLEQCEPRDIILGDGRLKLAQVKDKTYDVMIFDAFTGGSPPVHLLTKEAIAIYLSKLKDNGTILFNVSNGYLEFRYPIFSSAKEFNLDMYMLANKKTLEGEYSSIWIALTKNNNTIESITKNNILKWEKISEGRDIVWTDELNSILPVLKI
jgi:spermidine synthase